MWGCGPSLQRAFDEGRGLVVRRDVPRLASTLDRALRRGLIVAVVPGIYAPAGEVDVATRVRAATLFDPDAVVTDRAAAALTWWPELPVATVDLATRGRRADTPGIRWHQAKVPVDQTVEVDGVLITDAARTVLDLIPELDGDPVDEALRRGALTLADLEASFAASPNRPGNPRRRWILDDSRDEPWSGGERKFHRAYRELGLPYAYTTNKPMTLPNGEVRILDFAIDDLLLGFEVDGFEFHGTQEAFVNDRVSDAELATMSWQRTRFAGASLSDEAWVKATVLGIVTAREQLLRGTRPAGARVRGRRHPT